MPMRLNGLLPLALVFLMLLAVYFGYSQGHAIQQPKSLMPETPVDGAVFLAVSIALIYGGKALHRND